MTFIECTLGTCRWKAHADTHAEANRLHGEHSREKHPDTAAWWDSAVQASV